MVAVESADHLLIAIVIRGKSTIEPERQLWDDELVLSGIAVVRIDSSREHGGVAIKWLW